MIVVGMKLLKSVLWGLSICGLLSGAQLRDVKTVYLYPMMGGFDLLLAQQLVEGHIYRVVPDPKLADAVFTDQLGDVFLYKLDHIQTPPVAAKTSGSTSSMTPAPDTAPHGSTFARARGTLFLVDIKSKEVVWSTFQKPKNLTSTELRKSAQKSVKQLELDITGPKESH
jgi:hypothetical protein